MRPRIDSFLYPTKHSPCYSTAHPALIVFSLFVLVKMPYIFVFFQQSLHKGPFLQLLSREIFSLFYSFFFGLKEIEHFIFLSLQPYLVELFKLCAIPIKQ